MPCELIFGAQIESNMLENHADQREMVLLFSLLFFYVVATSKAIRSDFSSTTDFFSTFSNYNKHNLNKSFNHTNSYLLLLYSKNIHVKLQHPPRRLNFWKIFVQTPTPSPD